MIEVAGQPRRILTALVGFLSLLALSSCSRPSSTGGYPDFADLVERASPSVVNISTVSALPGSGPALGGGSESEDGLQNAPEWFRRFLEQNGAEPPDGALPSPAYPDGPLGELQPDDGGDAPSGAPQPLGSGFILWEDGYVLTNYHVVQDAKEVIVRLLDRRQFTAQVVGSDERSDIALLKIDAKGLPAVKLGEYSKLRPGQWVLAIGSPFGFDYSVTAGIVSAKGRNLVSEQYVPFVQTDVAINPGNSGGPLFNLDGEVVGVNSQIYSQSGGYQGVSFSIPIDVAAKVARQLKDRGRVTRGWLGVVVQEVDRNLAQTFGMERPVGALVARVMPGSPAERAGIKAGDVILSFNGSELQVSTALPPLVGNVDPGEVVPLVMQRDGKQVTIKVEVGELDNQDREVADGADSATGPVEPPPVAPLALLGLKVIEIPEEIRRRAHLVGAGVLVESVTPGAAQSAGIRRGDILQSIAGQEVGSPQRLAEIIGLLTPGVTVPVLINRNGVPSFLPLDVPTR
ncbi:serine protease Do [Hydrocarboniphaga daqingensis]|jgi:serine protease Do|uniref:Probable periplasmic serine endoprotease DegP-like n=1 Tax=Hydrocarboniphaga daqingensis TaxID=490188 RepID=A0A1M5KJ10_9GAMM|nr:Do family serine endopeptidase [Hydrocarboniphaga daqingensis]SHG52802.1 serine protease Do [Hydrocarboniphaga daqingensis]